MKTTFALGLFAATCVLGAANFASAVIVNIDVDGWRTAGGGNNGVPATVYVGTGAAGGGNVFNGVDPAAVSDNSASTSTGDNQTISGAALLNSTGGVTGVGFTIGPVGLDNEAPAATPLTDPRVLFDDYIFTHGAAGNTGANDPGNSSFAISGLTPGAPYYVYLYAGFSNTGFLNTTAITGGTIVPFTPTGIYTTGNTIQWSVAADGSGNINGTMGAGTQILGGLTVASVPEPTSVVLLGLGASGMCLAARRRKD